MKNPIKLKKVLIYGEIVLLFVISLLIVTTTYSYLTYQAKLPVDFTVGEVKIDVKAGDNETNVLDYQINTIAYIDLIEFTKQDNITNTMSTKLDILITNKSDINVRSKIEVGSLFALAQTPVEGILWLVVDSSVTDYNAYINDSIINTITTTDNNALRTEIRTKIIEHNHNYFKELYEGENILAPNEEKSIRIVFWGDYYSLSNPTDYLQRSYRIPIKVQALQNIADYGGVPSYEND